MYPWIKSGVRPVVTVQASDDGERGSFGGFIVYGEGNSKGLNNVGTSILNAGSS